MLGRLQAWLQGCGPDYEPRPWSMAWLGNRISDVRFYTWRATNLARRIAFNAIGWLAGWLLVRAAKLALAVGDQHEFEHIRAAITAGNSEGCTPATCVLLANAMTEEESS